MIPAFEILVLLLQLLARHTVPLIPAGFGKSTEPYHLQTEQTILIIEERHL